MWRIWLAALFWGLNWPIVKVLLDGVGPWTLRAYGLAAAFVVLALTTAAMRESPVVPRSHWRQLIIAALLNVVCFNILAVFAQMSMPASRAVILTYTMPLWSVVFARFMLGEKIDGLRSIALVMGAAGIALLARPFWDQFMRGELPIGLVYVMTAAITWAAGTIYTKKAQIPAAPIAVTAWQILIGAIVCRIGLEFFETPRLELHRPEIAWSFLYHVTLPQAASYVLWFGLMNRVAASTLSLGTLLVPVFGVVGSVVMIGERPPLLDIVGFVIILAAVVIDQGVRGWREQQAKS